VGSGSTGREWRSSAGGRGERGGADDGCPRRTGEAAAMAAGGSVRRSTRRKERKRRAKAREQRTCLRA
jgi:hypothetical protein